MGSEGAPRIRHGTAQSPSPQRTRVPAAWPSAARHNTPLGGARASNWEQWGICARAHLPSGGERQHAVPESCGRSPQQGLPHGQCTASTPHSGAPCRSGTHSVSLTGIRAQRVVVPVEVGVEDFFRVASPILAAFPADPWLETPALCCVYFLGEGRAQQESPGHARVHCRSAVPARGGADRRHKGTTAALQQQSLSDTRACGGEASAGGGGERGRGPGARHRPPLGGSRHLGLCA